MLAKDLDHPNLIKYKNMIKYTNGKTDEYHIIMDLMKGPDISSYIRYNGPIPSITTIKNIGKQLLLAIEYLHSNQIVHLDIKPSNIMFNQDYS